jgi:hypothetical protein
VSDETSVVPSHQQFDAPIWVEHVDEFAEQIVQDFRRMAIEQRKADQVKVIEPALEANSDA